MTYFYTRELLLIYLRKNLQKKVIVTGLICLLVKLSMQTDRMRNLQSNVRIYLYCKEREEILGMFWNLMRCLTHHLIFWSCCFCVLFWSDRLCRGERCSAME